jgi:hypothetical protein
MWIEGDTPTSIKAQQAHIHATLARFDRLQIRKAERGETQDYWRYHEI